MSKTFRLLDTDVESDLHIFILEDTPAYQTKIRATLSDIGFDGKFTLATSIKEAFDLLQKAEKKPGFFLCDWNLPDGVGVDFLKHVKSLESHKDTPSLMVTTLDDISNILEAVRLGADGYIVKPFDEAEVIEKMSFALDKRAA